MNVLTSMFCEICAIATSHGTSVRTLQICDISLVLPQSAYNNLGSDFLFASALLAVEFILDWKYITYNVVGIWDICVVMLLTVLLIFH